MPYSSGDWTSRTKYLLGSNLCFPKSDEDALQLFLTGFPSDINVAHPPCGCSEASPVPFFPVYNGPPASMRFDAGLTMTLTDSSAILCEFVMITDTSGKIGIWATVDASGDPITLTISINGIDIVTTTSLYIFYGTPTVETAGSYTIRLSGSNTGTTDIASSRLMAVGLLS